jgi:hypothetical protein
LEWARERRYLSVFIRPLERGWWPRASDFNAISEPSIPAVQITVFVESVFAIPPETYSMLSLFMPVTFVLSFTSTPIFARRLDALSLALSGKKVIILSKTSTLYMRTSSLLSLNFSHSIGVYSASSPAISTPVKPAPMI